MTNDKIFTCYGCPLYHPIRKGDKVNYKHCGQDHFECPYYLGTGVPLGKKEREQ